MPETHQDRTDGLLTLFQTAPRSITAAFDDDEPYKNWALQESESCPTCGEEHPPEQTAECPYGGCEPGEHCPYECPYETGHTNWDYVYPHLNDTVHRGVAVHVPGHDPDAPHHETAQNILDYLGEHGLGTHWSDNESQGRHYAHVSHVPGHHNLHVVIHAAKPDRNDIEDDPHELLKQDVIGFDQHPDAEIPLQRHARVNVTGVSWQSPGTREWSRHDFATGMVQHKAARDFFGPTEPGHCTICKKPLAENCPYGGGCPKGEHCETHCPYEGSWSDWDRYYPRVPDTVHRGFALNIPAPDPTSSGDQVAQHILSHLDEGTGMHWTAKADEARSAAARHHIPGHTNLHVILRAAKPAREHLETDPDRLVDHAVFGYETSDEAEVPMRSGAPVHITGVSWKSPGARDWAHHDFQQPIRRQANGHTAGGKPWLPHDRFFSPGHRDLDPRLFDGTRLKPAWRRALLGLVNRAFADYTYRVPGGWQRWARAYLAGSQASHWYGNDDLDVLVGIDYDAFRRAQPRYRAMSDREIDDMLNARAHEVCDPARWFTIDGEHLGPFDSTVYVNPDSWDIRRIKPYAAYDLGANRWAVEPMEVPDDFGPDKLPSADFLYARSLASQVRSLKKLPAGQAQALGAALYDKLHGERHDAFSGHGGGLYDVRNVAWKYLALHPERPMEQLVAWKRAEQASEPFSITSMSKVAALPNSEADHESNADAERDEWFHGTHHAFDAPQVDESAERAAKAKDWNTSLGTHWTSRHDVAEQVALGQPHETEFMGRDELQNRQRSARVLHARLHIANPKRYASEYDMDREVYGHEFDTGNHPSRHDPEHLSNYEGDPHLGHEQDLRRFPDWEQPHHDDEEDGDNWYDQEDESSGDARGRFSWWLSRHPDRYGIGQRFKQRLIDAGHDGIVYGNEYEGRGGDAEGHASAITFHPHQSEVRQAHPAGWGCMDEDEAEDYRREHPGHPHTAGMNGPGSDADFNNDSVMIALVPPRDVAERLVLPDGKGEPADQMHITLAYIPHVAAGDLGRLTGTVAEWASRQQPIVARVQGVGTFVNPGKHVLWGAVDIPGSSHLHSSLVDALRAAKFQPSQEHGFVPHLTLSYEKYHVRFLPKITPESFTCHSVYVCQGDNWRPVPVGGSTGGKVA